MEGVPSPEPLQGMHWLSQLPDDVLWTILGFLDLRTLCTARLVCKRLRKTAAERFKALDCKILEKPPTTDFTQFSGTTYLAVTVSHKSHLQSLAHPRIAPVITHVSLKGFHLWDRQSTEELEALFMRLPKLRSVSLQPLGGDLCLPLFPPTLEELEIADRQSYSRLAGVGDVSPLTRCTQLTSLAIELVVGPGTSVGSLSSLRNLRCLNLRNCSFALGPLSTFTALTSLTFEQKCSGGDGSIFQDLGRLTGLSRLALTRIMTPDIVTHEDLRCIAQLTNLTCLDMRGCRLADWLAGSTALMPLTRLVSVRFPGIWPLVSWPQVEALRGLSLVRVSDVSILQEATRLTHLEIWCCPSLPGLCPAVAGMSRLHSLVIKSTDPCSKAAEGSLFRLDVILQACTMLTKLDYRWGKLRPESDLIACASLPGLRSLSFSWIRELTPAGLPALQALSGLTELSLLGTGMRVADMTPDVIAAFDAERRKLGWPLLKLRVRNRSDGECFERL